ncbi:MAG: metal-dependent transcriptional regulator [archaeon]
MENCRVILGKSSENEEMYLKAVWLLEEGGKCPVHAADVAKTLGLALPSVVEMFKKLQQRKLVKYDGRKGVKLLSKGRVVAQKIVRNLRLTEVWFRDVLKIDFNSTDPCRFEHVITDDIAKALSRGRGYPAHCPHGKLISKIFFFFFGFVLFF